MKLDKDYFKITTVPDYIVSDILNTITETDWFDNDYRRTCANAMQKCNSIPILHSEMCAAQVMDNSVIRHIHKFSAYDKLFPKIEPVLDILKNYYEFRQVALFISRLEPHSSIPMHPDKGNFLTKCNRIHLPLQTNEKVKYIIENNSYYWERGSLYEFDNTRVHGVINSSNEYRIHLVINLYNLTDEELNLE